MPSLKDSDINLWFNVSSNAWVIELKGLTDVNGVVDWVVYDCCDTEEDAKAVIKQMKEGDL